MLCQVEKQIDSSQRNVRLTVHASHQFMVEKEGRERRWINWKIACWTVITLPLRLGFVVNDSFCCCCLFVFLFFVLFFVWTENVSVTPQQNICCNIQQASCGWRAHVFNLKSRFFSKHASDWLEYMTLMLTFNQLLLVVVDEVTKTWPLSPPAASVWWTERTALAAYHHVWRTERTSVTLYERQRRHLSLTLCGGQRKHLSPCVKDRENTYHWPCVKDRTPITLCERQREHLLSCMTDRENTYHRVWKTERTLATTCMTDRENTHHRVGWTERALVTACMTTERTLPPVWRTERTPITVYDGQREH